MAEPLPTMIPDKMGIIGNTQGVSESSKPKPKKLTKIRGKLRLARRAPTRDDSSIGATVDRAAIDGTDIEGMAEGADNDVTFVDATKLLGTIRASRVKGG